MGFTAMVNPALNFVISPFFNGSVPMQTARCGDLLKKRPGVRFGCRADQGEGVKEERERQNSAQSSSSMLKARLPWLAGLDALRGLGARSS